MNRLFFLKSSLVLLFLSLVCVAQSIPRPPVSALPAFGEVRWAESTPVSGAPPAIWRATENCLELPMKFQSPGQWRQAWDIPVEANLENVNGVAFDFYLPDIDFSTNLSLYLHSGEGWYRLPFSVQHEKRWNHIVIPKFLAEAEGKPAGWGKIDDARISIECFRDPDGVVAGLANLCGGERRDKVLVIEGVSYKAVRPQSNLRLVTNFVTQTLDALNVAYTAVADLEVTRELLQDSKVVILPNNPVVPEGLTDQLAEFVAQGGKLLAANSIPSEVAALLQIQLTGRETIRAGRLQGFLATSEALGGQPPLARQEVSNTNVAKLVGEGSVIATWANPDGTDSGLPAAVKTPAGVYLGNIWLGPFGENASQFYLSILSELSSEVLRLAANDALRNVGVAQNYEGLEDIQRRFPEDASPEAKVALENAFALLDQAQKHLDAEDWLSCLELCRQAEERVEEAIARIAKQGPAAEQRAFWCHNAFGLPGCTWDEAIKFLADNGFNTILGNFLWAGAAFFPNTFIPVYSDFASQGDQLRQCLDAGRKYGVKCHAWVVVGDMGYLRDKEFARRMQEEHRTQVSFTGNSDTTFLCLTQPENRQILIGAMLDMVRNYPDLAGLHFDYIRYPGPDYCFCDVCRETFEERLGHAVENWPAEVREEPLLDKWRQFRCDQVSSLVKQVHDEAKGLNPNLEISAAVVKNIVLAKNNVGQDWEEWCRNGWLDFVCPMDYTDSLDKLTVLIRQQLTWSHGVRLCPGLGLSIWKEVSNPLTLIEQIDLVRQFGLPGFTVFDFDPKAQAVLPLLRLGSTREATK